MSRLSDSTPASNDARRSRSHSGPPISSGHFVYHLFSGLVMTALFVRLFLPAESVAQGDTLWIVALWLVCGLIWLAGAWRGAIPGFRPDWSDGMLALWIGGQVASTMAIILGGGDKRAAVNTNWEWIGVGLAWLILHHALTNDSFRRSLVRATIVTGTVVAGLGLYQHYVSFPQTVAKFGKLFDQLRDGTSAQAVAARRMLANEGIPTESSAAILYEKRLRDSREPMGLFALANTLGGTLAVCLLLAIGQVQVVRRRGAPWQMLVPLLVSVGVIGWCLLLTKSRTAWIGTAVGIAILTTVRFRPTWRHSRVLAVGTAGVILITTLLVWLGGLDQQVLSEAPKSLAYRLQYWQATRRLIADHPWLGVGPGNFRQSYLKYKLPQASEEIADPHNMFFDVAATAGIPSVLGMGLFLAFVVAASVGRLSGSPGNSLANPDPSAVTRTANQPSSRPAFWFAGLGAPVAFASLLEFAGEWEDRLLVTAAAWVALAFWFDRSERACNRQFEDEKEDCRTALAAFGGLCVHLLGAGGIGMPGVSQWLFAMAAIAMAGVQRKSLPLTAIRFPSPGILLGAATLILAAFGLTQTALLPVTNSRSWVRQGDLYAINPTDQRDVARERYLLSAKADPWNAEPWRRQFELLAAGEIQSNEKHAAAVNVLLETMSRDPANFWGPRQLGRLWLSRWGTTHNPDDAHQGVVWLRRAHQFYPTNSEILADLVVGLEATGQRNEAINMAQAAVAQDEIYRKWGHIDRYLPDQTLQWLRQLIATATQ